MMITILLFVSGANSKQTVPSSDTKSNKLKMKIYTRTYEVADGTIMVVMVANMITTRSMTALLIAHHHSCYFSFVALTHYSHLIATFTRSTLALSICRTAETNWNRKKIATFKAALNPTKRTKNCLSYPNACTSIAGEGSAR